MHYYVLDAFLCIGCFIMYLMLHIIGDDPAPRDGPAAARHKNQGVVASNASLGLHDPPGPVTLREEERYKPPLTLTFLTHAARRTGWTREETRRWKTRRRNELLWT